VFALRFSGKGALVIQSFASGSPEQFIIGGVTRTFLEKENKIETKNIQSKTQTTYALQDIPLPLKP